MSSVKRRTLNNTAIARRTNANGTFGRRPFINSYGPIFNANEGGPNAASLLYFSLLPPTLLAANVHIGNPLSFGGSNIRTRCHLPSLKFYEGKQARFYFSIVEPITLTTIRFLVLTKNLPLIVDIFFIHFTSLITQ